MRSQQSLPGDRKARRCTNEQRNHTGVTEARHVRERLVPVILPMRDEVPGERSESGEPDDGVQEQTPFNRGIEWAECDSQARRSSNSRIAAVNRARALAQLVRMRLAVVSEICICPPCRYNLQ